MCKIAYDMGICNINAKFSAANPCIDSLFGGMFYSIDF